MTRARGQPSRTLLTQISAPSFGAGRKHTRKDVRPSNRLSFRTWAAD